MTMQSEEAHVRTTLEAAFMMMEVLLVMHAHHSIQVKPIGM